VEGKGRKPKPEAVGRFCCSRLFYFKAVGNRFHGLFFEREAFYVNHYGRKGNRGAA
jgi:hypothetical protein